MNRTFTLKAFLLIVCCHYFSANGQQPPIAKKDNKSYTIIQIGAGILPFANNKDGLLGISFPYSVTDSSGTTIDTSFSKKTKPFSNSLLAAILPISVEFGTEKIFGSVQFIVIPTPNGSFIGLTGGYGRNFYYSGFDMHPSNAEKGTLVLKPSLNISFRQYGYGLFSGNSNVLGEIDNSYKTINLLGHTIDPTFDVTNTDNNTNVTTTTTYNATVLDLNYVHREWVLMPKIAIASNQYKHHFYWEVNLGYNIALSKKDGIGLIQSDDGGDSKRLAFINLYNKNTLVTYNNNVITKSPYNFSGLFFGFSIGWVVSKKKQ